MGKKYLILEYASWGFHLGYGFFGVIGLHLGLFTDGFAAFCICLAIGACVGYLLGAGIGIFVCIGGGIREYLYAWRVKREESSARAKRKEAAASHPSVGLILLFRCLGKLAKADGPVAREEADFIQSLLKEFESLDHNGRQVLIDAFNAGKEDRLWFRTMVRKLHTHKQKIPKDIMQIFCSLAMADGAITDAERAMLQEAEEVLGQSGYSERFFREHGGEGSASGSRRSSSGQQRASGRGRQSSSGQQRSSRHCRRSPASAELNEAYRLLGVSSAATDAEIKSAWRRKVLEFHPDKVQAKGLPEAFVAFANEQSRKLNQAYETICKARGIK